MTEEDWTDYKIDVLQLDVEAAQQAELFYIVAEEAVEARAEVDRAKQSLDVLEANLQMECRKDPDSFGLEKSTEKSIEAAVKRHRTYQDGFSDYITIRKKSALWDKRVQTMEMRKRMLEALITLHGQQYFAGPSAPRDLAAVWESQKEAAEQRTNERMKLRKRKKRKRIRKKD